MTHHKLKNVVTIYDFGRNVGGISPIATKVSIGLAGKYNVYYCAAESVDFVDDELRKNVNYIKLCRIAESGKPELLRAIYSIANIAAGYRLYKILKQLDPEETVIHVHGWGMALSGFILWVARAMSFKVVYTVHDFSMYCPNGVYYDFGQNIDCKIKPLSFSCLKAKCDKKGHLVKTQRIIRKLFDKYVWRVHRSISKMIYVSESVFQTFSEFYPIDISYKILRNPAERVGAIEDKDRSIFLYVGRLTEEKGVLLLAKVMCDLGLPITYCGAGELENSNALKEKGISVTGWLPRKEIECYYRKAKVLIVPSLWRETSGLIVDEAIQMGVPCVVPSQTGAAEKILATSAGVVFERGSENDLRDKILMMLDPVFYSKCVENCQKSKKYWTYYDEYIESIEKIYEEI